MLVDVALDFPTRARVRVKELGSKPAKAKRAINRPYRKLYDHQAPNLHARYYSVRCSECCYFMVKSKRFRELLTSIREEKGIFYALGVSFSR